MAITEHQHPCWDLTCDRCGEHPGDQDGYTPHYETRDDASRAASDHDMRSAYGWTVCGACLDNVTYDIACLACGAPADVPCMWPAGSVANGTNHDEREEAWIVEEKARAAERERQIGEEAPDA